jgi:ribonuclease P protein component
MNSSPKQLLPRSTVLRRRGLLHRIRQQGRRRLTTVVQLTTLTKPGPSSEQVAFLTPKSLGSAVLRNRLRRQMREIYRRQLAATSRTDQYYVWTARRESAQATFAQMEQTMHELWKHVALRSPSSAPTGL